MCGHHSHGEDEHNALLPRDRRNKTRTSKIKGFSPAFSGQIVTVKSFVDGLALCNSINPRMPDFLIKELYGMPNRMQRYVGDMMFGNVI